MILHQVLTTEKVPFSYRVAGMGSRFLAWLVDVSAIGLLGLMGVLLSAPLELGRAGLGHALVILWVWVLKEGYFLLFEWLWHGQTPGKRLLGIRVIRWRGTAISFYQAAVRNLLRVADALPAFYALGFAVAALNREHRRLGDLAADTLVVHVDRRAPPVRALHDSAAETDPDRLALFRQRLVQLDREQKQTLLDLCLRREQLRVAERARLFQAAATFVRERLDLAPQPYESNEKFVLQLAAVLGERGEPLTPPTPLSHKGRGGRGGSPPLPSVGEGVGG
jgi:uncharacterized RDD family membrane protein YckC